MINLEKELIKQNKRLVTPLELLAIKEYDRLGSLNDNDALERIGIDDSISLGAATKDRISKQKKMAEKFNQERVFHISQIEGICKKYDLKFLPSHLFKGSLCPELPQKIGTFETAYAVKCFSKWRLKERFYNITPEDRSDGNTFIAAPKSSFKLREKPKDPLLFYEISKEYYYLIHKWGNDLSIFRRLRVLLDNPHFFILGLLSVGSITLLLNLALPALGTVSYVVFGAMCIGFYIAFLCSPKAKEEKADNYWLSDIEE